MSTVVAEAEETVVTQDRQISAEIVAVIAAAAAALLGRGIRIRSIDSLPDPHEMLSRWTQQGRVNVQGSHNLKRKR